MKFKILSKDTQSKARTGKIQLERGTINTPIFMPVGTLGTVKGLFVEDVKKTGAQIILGNIFLWNIRTVTKLGRPISLSLLVDTLKE